MELIQRESDLRNVIGALSREPLVGADTEAAGYHRYHNRICLLQLSTRSRTWLVDALAIREMAPLGAIFGDTAVEVVFHDADYDLRLLQRDFGIQMKRLFDTKVAAQFLGEPSFGLASLLDKYLGVTLEKKYQRADWAERPLPPAMLAYAAEDTRHLPQLRDLLRERLEASGRLGWAEEEFRMLERVSWEAEPEDMPFLRLKNTRDLDSRQLAALRELHEWRESLARVRDVAPFRVIGNEALVEVARRLPGSREQLKGISGLGTTLAERYGDDLIAASARALALSERDLPRRPRPERRAPYDPDLETIADALKTVRDDAARELGIDRGFLMPRDQLRDIARARPTTTAELAAIAGVRRWQSEALGERLIETLRSYSAVR
ncbi:MAG: ribonuclease D [Longimicrobiales bacterium]